MRQALGKGLDALISQDSVPAPTTEGTPAATTFAVQKIPIEKIHANHLQPRKRFDSEKIKELSDSIKEHGLAQPILVSKSPTGEGYELIAGERRLRASQLAGVKEIECIIKPVLPDSERLAVTLIENLQREDLNPIEEALGYRQLIQEFNFTQSQVAQTIGKSRVAVANTLRLLDLPKEAQLAIDEGKLSEGHGRAILMVEDVPKRVALLQLVLLRQLNVRQTEDAARAINEGIKAKKAADKSPEIRTLETDLQHLLGTKVELRTGKQNRGSLVIHYYSLDDFDRILEKLKSAYK